MNAREDRQRHTPSWYADSAGEIPVHPRLQEPVEADVAVIGGGFGGLSAALHLANHGLSVVLVEAARIGWGASGRNGGQVHSGFRRGPDWFEARDGERTARQVHALGERAKELILSLIERHKIDCDYRPGLIEAFHRKTDVIPETDQALRLNDRFGGDALLPLSANETAERLGTDVYYGGLFDPGGGHLHPLKFALGLARAGEAAGVRLFEQSPVSRITRTNGKTQLHTHDGVVSANQVVMAGNGYVHGLSARYDARVLPITNFIVASEPIGAGMEGGILKGGECAADSRFVVHYWRPTPDGRLLFGGGEKFSTAFPKDIEAFVRQRLARIYPQLAGVGLTHAWGGTLAVTQNRLPYVRKVENGTYVLGGFSGQGVALAPLAGKVVADAIAGAGDEFALMEGFACPPFPGGRLFRPAILSLAMSFFALRDRL